MKHILPNIYYTQFQSICKEEVSKKTKKYENLTIGYQCVKILWVIKMETRKANVIVGNAGGNTGKSSNNYKISIPNRWINEMGISKDNREVSISFDGEKIMISKKETFDEFISRKKVLKHSLKIFEFIERQSVLTKICADFTDETLCIENYTDNKIKTAFGVNENPEWHDFLEFLESRCIPKTRSGIKEYLSVLGLYEYDALEIVKITKGKMSEDNMILKIEEL